MELSQLAADERGKNIISLKMKLVMNWLRQQTEMDKTARQILAINPGSGLTIPRDRWQYVGFKGGSEPGVLNMTYLLQSTKGVWYAVSIPWNNPQAPL